jgi:allophanate hydrolase
VASPPSYWGNVTSCQEELSQVELSQVELSQVELSQVELGLGALRAEYTARRLSPRDVVELVLARVDRRGDDAVWISRHGAELLRRRADELQLAAGRRGGDLSAWPLYGVPCAIKDNIDVAGLPTTAGCPGYAYQPAQSAACVRRLVEAGAIVIGKTNMDQFATGLTGTRSPYGVCRNVHGGDMIPGGSSSGSAVAVAAGLVSFALGTDTAGSGRVPAALNGIVGCKPTRGLVSTNGIVPACRSLDCVSIFTAGVADAGTVLRVLAQPEPTDPWSRAAAPPRHLPARPVIALPAADELDFDRDGGVQRAFDTMRERICASSEVVITSIEPLLEAGELLYRGPWVAERLAELEAFFAQHPDEVLPVTRRVIESGRRFDAVETFRAQHRLQELRHWTEEQLWQRADLLVLPTVPTTFTVDEIAQQPIERNSVLGRYTQFVNLLDLAAVAVPTGYTADGRPASVSVIGPAFSDALLRTVGAELAHR